MHQNTLWDRNIPQIYKLLMFVFNSKEDFEKIGVTKFSKKNFARFP